MKIRNVLLSVLLIALLGYCARQQFAESEARADAEKVAAAVEKHRAAKGAYPATLGDVGFDPESLKDKWHLNYRLVDGKPMLFYSAQNNWLVAYHYNFESKTWESRD